VVTGMKSPASHGVSAQKVSVNYLDDPTRRDWGGKLNATYTFVGTYSVTVPRARSTRSSFGSPTAARWARPTWCTRPGISSRATWASSRWSTWKNVSAFWIYHNDTTIGKVLALIRSILLRDDVRGSGGSI